MTASGHRCSRSRPRCATGSHSTPRRWGRHRLTTPDGPGRVASADPGRFLQPTKGARMNEPERWRVCATEARCLAAILAERASHMDDGPAKDETLAIARIVNDRADSWQAQWREYMLATEVTPQ